MAGAGGAFEGCSDTMSQRLEGLEETGAVIDAARLESTEQLALACFRIADDLGFGPAPLGLPPAFDDVRSACQSAVTALDTTLAELVTVLSIEREACACSRDPDVYYACLEPCEALGDVTSCHEFCFCPTYCDAQGLARPHCSACTVTVGVDHETLALTLDANLPVVYTVLDRADLVAWSADKLVEAGVELGHLFDEDSCVELVAPLNRTLELAEEREADLRALASQAAGIAEAL
jgi:hypothetical protein